MDMEYRIKGNMAKQSQGGGAFRLQQYETHPITAADHTGYDSHFDHGHKLTLMTPHGMVYEDGSPPCSLDTYLEVLKCRYGERLYLHVSI